MVMMMKIVCPNPNNFPFSCQSSIKTLSMNTVHLTCRKTSKVQREFRCLNNSILIMFIHWNLVFVVLLMAVTITLKKIL